MRIITKGQSKDIDKISIENYNVSQNSLMNAAANSIVSHIEKYSSSIYQERLGTEKITLKDKYSFNKKQLLKRLQNNIKNYKKFKKLYFGIQSKNFSSQDISNYLINN